MAIKKHTASQISTSKEEFPSVENLFSESFDLFKKSLKQVIIFAFLTFGVSFLVAIVLLISIVVSGFLGAGVASKAQSFSIAAFLPAIIIIFISFLALMVISLASQIGNLLILDKPNTDTVTNIFKKSFSYVIPYLALSIISFLVVVPLFFLFIIPGIIVSILLSLASYELVLEKRGILSSMRRSIYVVKSNFWSIIGRSLIFTGLVGALFIASFALSGYTKGLGSLIFFPINLFISFYSLPYFITLFKHAEKATADKQKESGLLWIFVLSIISLVLVISVATTVVKSIISNPEVQNFIMQTASNRPESSDSAGIYKNAFKSTFVKSCNESAGEDSKYCDCIGTYLVDKYSQDQLLKMAQDVSKSKTAPKELTQAATYCISK